MKASANSKKHSSTSTAGKHDDILRLLKSTEHIDVELWRLNTKSIDAKLLNNKFQKAKLIKDFDTKFGITLFNLHEKGNENDVCMDDGFFALVKQAFRVSRAKPATYNEVKQLFVSVVRASSCKYLIKSKQGKTKKDRDVTVYTLNEALLKYHLELSGFKNKSCRGFSQEVVDKFGLSQVEGREIADHFIGDLDA